MEEFDSSKNTRILWSMLIGSIVTFAVLYGPQTLIQQYTVEFDLSASQASLVVSIATFTLAFSLLIIAAFSNAWGRRKIMVVSLVSAAVLNIALAFSPNYETLLVIRALQGIALGGFPAIAMTYLAEEIEPLKLGKIMGVYVSGCGFGGFFGRITVSTLSDFYSWHIAILILGLLNLLCAVIFTLLLPASRHFIVQRLSLHNWWSGIQTAGSDSRLWLLYCIGFISLGIYVALFNYISFPLVKAPFYLSQTIIGLLFVFQLTGSLGSSTVGALIGRFSRTQLLIASIIMTFCGALLTTVQWLPAVMFGLFIFAVGFFGCHSIASGWVSITAKPEAKSYASSLYLLFYYMGSSFIGSSGGVFYELNGWFGVIELISICLLCAIIITLRIHYVIHKNKELQLNNRY